MRPLVCGACTVDHLPHRKLWVELDLSTQEVVDGARPVRRKLWVELDLCHHTGSCGQSSDTMSQTETQHIWYQDERILVLN